MPRRIPRQLVVALLLLLAPLSAAHACECAWRGAREAFSGSQAVFLGRAVSFRPSLLQPWRYEVTRFEVERVWKGDVRRRESVVTGQSGSSCDLSFADDGIWYVVFAQQDEMGRLTTHQCSGTQAVTIGVDSVLVDHRPSWPGRGPNLPAEGFAHSITQQGGRLLAELGPGGEPLPDPLPDPWPAVIGWGTVAVVALLAFAAGRVRR